MNWSAHTFWKLGVDRISEVRKRCSRVKKSSYIHINQISAYLNVSNCDIIGWAEIEIEMPLTWWIEKYDVEPMKYWYLATPKLHLL